MRSTDDLPGKVLPRQHSQKNRKETTIRLSYAVVDREHRCRLNGIDPPAVAGCIDEDLNFSSSTNLLPIRRLILAVGQNAPVKAAWLKFPSFELEPLSQVYSRIDESTYRYESAEDNLRPT